MSRPPHGADADEAQLRTFGYTQQLMRGMGGFSNFAVSFSVISILTGAVVLYGHGLRFGGPFEMTVGWPLVTVLTLPIAASMAELASAYPTAGALYHWSSILGGRGAGFFTAWLNTIGQFAVTAAIDYGLAKFVAAMCGLAGAHAVLVIYATILLSHGVLNHVGVRVVATLNDLSAIYHVAGVIALITALAVFAPHRSASFLLERYTEHPRGFGLGFCIGLLQAQWTFTGYDASAHVTEETVDASRNAPRGLFLSVLMSGVAGYVLLLAVTLSIGDLGSALRVREPMTPFIAIVRTAVGSGLGDALVWMTMGAMWFCGLSSITSNSRMLFAFARDGGVPLSSAVAAVSTRFRTPHVAVWTSVVAAFLLALWSGAFNAMAALSTIALYASYALPIAFAWRARRAGRCDRGPWNLGRWSGVVNALALAWCAALTVLFVFPPNELAGYTFAGALAALALYWLASMRRRFRGPPFLGTESTALANSS